MANSSKRILTTHTGSLPRPGELMPMVEAREEGKLTDTAAFESSLAAAVDEIVRKQVESGVDVVNDGEVSKISYSTYVKDRLTGFEGQELLSASGLALADIKEFPEMAARLFSSAGMNQNQGAGLRRPDQVQESARSRNRYRQSQCRNQRCRGSGRVHERGLARRRSRGSCPIDITKRRRLTSPRWPTR